jgi:hypothetical protein
MKNNLKTVSLDTMINKHIGKRGTTRRETFENELKIELLWVVQIVSEQLFLEE